MKTICFIFAAIGLLIGCQQKNAPASKPISQSSKQASSASVVEQDSPKTQTWQKEQKERSSSASEPEQEPESSSVEVPLLGVSPGDSFSEATAILRKEARQVRETGNPSVQYSTEFIMNDGIASIYSDPSPEPPRGQTPVSSVVFRADINDFSKRTVRKMYDDYKEKFSQQYGSNSPESHDLGSIQVYNWEWTKGDKTIEIEYQQENGLPYSTKVKVGE